jgi:hypothetical protein
MEYSVATIGWIGVIGGMPGRLQIFSQNKRVIPKDALPKNRHSTGTPCKAGLRLLESIVD